MVTQNRLRTNEGKIGLFGEKNLFISALDHIKCHKQIKWQRLHPTCAPIAELPSSIRYKAM